MKSLRQYDPIAILVSDLHLRHTPPVARAEQDWYKVMERQCAELRELQVGLSMICNTYIPVVCAGDIFDKWNSPPELINFAIENLPRMYVVPGQHDLPNHRLQDIKRSAYWTLVKAAKVINLQPGRDTPVCPGYGGESSDYLRLWGFPWGWRDTEHKLEPKRGSDLEVHVAVVHEYSWQKGAAYPNAPPEGYSAKLQKTFRHFDAVTTGDNHKGFLVKAYGKLPYLCNNGGFFRINSDEKGRIPKFGLLHKSGKISRHPLRSCEQDKFLDDEELKEKLVEYAFDGRALVAELTALQNRSMDFHEALLRFMQDNSTPEEIKQEVLSCLSNRTG